eukprot:4119153-Prymnesium_polylepis.1
MFCRCAQLSKIKDSYSIGNCEVQKLELQPETRVALTIQAYNMRTRICTCAYNRSIKEERKVRPQPHTKPQ